MIRRLWLFAIYPVFLRSLDVLRKVKDSHCWLQWLKCLRSLMLTTVLDSIVEFLDRWEASEPVYSEALLPSLLRARVGEGVSGDTKGYMTGAGATSKLATAKCAD